MPVRGGPVPAAAPGVSDDTRAAEFLGRVAGFVSAKHRRASQTATVPEIAAAEHTRAVAAASRAAAFSREAVSARRRSSKLRAENLSACGRDCRVGIATGQSYLRFLP